MTKPSKYRNVKKVVDNVTFHSIREADRYIALKTLFRAGEIFDLALQPFFDFKLDGKKMFRYIADFSYTEKDGETVIEDVKGAKTAVYRLKKKLIEHQHGIRILET